MPSFDIVSEVDAHELTNAVDQANREISNRFDFKGSNASIELSDESITLVSDSDFQVDQMFDVLLQKLAKRGLDVSCLERGKIETAGKGVKQAISVRQGIDQAMGKKITKLIKDQKLKVQAQIQGEQVRVTGKKRDDLQSVIALLRDAELGIPLQYINMRD